VPVSFVNGRVNPPGTHITYFVGMLYRRIIIRPGDGYFVDVSEVRPPERGKTRVHLFLFLATVLTTMAAGSYMATGRYPFESIGTFLRGFPFSATILCILGIHEFAHYFSARYWGINVTLPYFIPAPILPLGTFGAVIKMKSSIPNRKALVDVGASGPIAGFVVSVAACVVGLSLSEAYPLEKLGNEYGFMLGESLLFKALGWVVLGNMPDNYVVELHPVAFAGWIGLFVTALNLLPVGQLDGGHVLFALSPRWHGLFGRIRIPVLLLMGLSFWSGWYVWALLSLFFGRTHPYPDRMEPDIGVVRTVIAVTAMVIFVLCIMPTPIRTQ